MLCILLKKSNKVRHPFSRFKWICRHIPQCRIKHLQQKGAATLQYAAWTKIIKNYATRTASLELFEHVKASNRAQYAQKHFGAENWCSNKGPFFTKVLESSTSMTGLVGWLVLFCISKYGSWRFGVNWCSFNPKSTDDSYPSQCHQGSIWSVLHSFAEWRHYGVGMGLHEETAVTETVWIHSWTVVSSHKR